MKLIPKALTRTMARSLLQAKKQSPHVFFVGGIAGVIGGTVLACRATLNLEATLDGIKSDIEAVKTLHKESGLDVHGVNVTEREYQYSLGHLYGKSGVALIKLYGPAIAVTAVSIGALTGSHIQMTRRNTALTVTLAAVSKAYEEYRMRVVDAIGANQELEIYRNTQPLVDPNDKKMIYNCSDPTKGSPYAALFADHNLNWKKDVDHNRIFIDCQERYANQKLASKGHLFLNEVYDSLGLDRTQAGSVVGWIYNSKNGDNYVDFCMFQEANADFIEGKELNIWLDFNVDGIVYDKI